MVKKAETLKSLDELNISDELKNYLTKEGDSIDEAVWRGRYIAYVQTHYKSGKLALELMHALDEAGYIRHDIKSSSFTINRIYHKVFGDTVDAIAVPKNFEDFCVTFRKTKYGKTVRTDYRLGNERYEKFKNPTKIQLDMVKNAIRICLTGKEYDVFAYRFGLEGGVCHHLDQVGVHFGMSRERARWFETIALKKIRARNTLPTSVLS